MNEHNGINDLHAFSVGKATGININNSPAGAVGASMSHASSSMKHTAIHQGTIGSNHSAMDNRLMGMAHINSIHDKNK